MSRIGNALLKDSAVQRLKIVKDIVDRIDDSADDPVDGFQPEGMDNPPRSRIVIAAVSIGVIGALIGAVVIGSSILHKHGLKAPTQRSAAKVEDYAEQFQMSVQAFRNHDYDGALQGFLRLREASPARQDSPLLLVNIGMTYKAEGDVQNARKFYQAAIQADPKYAVAYNNLAMLTANAGDLPAAKRLLEKALSEDPGLVAALVNLGRISEQAGHWSSASAYYSQYVDSAKGDPSVKEELRKRIQKLQPRVESETKERTEQ